MATCLAGAVVLLLAEDAMDMFGFSAAARFPVDDLMQPHYCLVIVGKLVPLAGGNEERVCQLRDIIAHGLLHLQLLDCNLR